jgi:hypothetical protein
MIAHRLYNEYVLKLINYKSERVCQKSDRLQKN